MHNGESTQSTGVSSPEAADQAVHFLTALPVYNEVAHVDSVLDLVKKHSPNVLAVDDGSTDGTSDRLKQRSDIQVLLHPQNRGYGAALASAFEYAISEGYQWLVTIDCDGQHQPRLIGNFIQKAMDSGVDIVSGSRYLQKFEGDSEPPEQRLWVNRQITADLNRMFGFQLTDAFCGFKAYRVASLRKLKITEFGYGMPLQLWVQAACHNLKVVELPVPLVYTGEARTFGEHLDDTATRLNYYHQVIDRAIEDLPCGCEKEISKSSG